MIPVAVAAAPVGANAGPNEDAVMNADRSFNAMAQQKGVATAFAALRSRSEAAGRRLAFAGSIVVMAAGTFWFIQRVFFPGGIS